MAIIVPDYFGEAFSRSYLQAQQFARQEAERKRQEEDLRKSLEVMAGTNAPLPEDTTMRPTVVQTPTAPLPGQGTVTTQPSAPVAEVAPVQTQTTTADLPQKDPYKEGLRAIEQNYREKIKNVTQMKNPALALSFLQQSMQERDMLKAEHNSAAFQAALNEIMNNPNLTPAQRIGMAVKANSTFKAGFKVNDIVKMFETEGLKIGTTARPGAAVWDGKQWIVPVPALPRGGQSGSSGRPINPNTHDQNTGLPLGAKEKWARTYENTGLIRDENLLAEYENYLGVYQADPESVEGIAAKKWLDANQRRVNIASDNRNQYWTISSGGAYQAGQSNNPPAQSPQQPPQASNESPEDKERRLKAILGI